VKLAIEEDRLEQRRRRAEWRRRDWDEIRRIREEHRLKMDPPRPQGKGTIPRGDDPQQTRPESPSPLDHPPAESDPQDEAETERHKRKQD
jgi:hypothetical protein